MVRLFIIVTIVCDLFFEGIHMSSGGVGIQWLGANEPNDFCQIIHLLSLVLNFSERLYHKQ